MDELVMATRRLRENILKGVLETAGDQPVSRITKASIIAGKDRRTGHQARHFLDTVRGMFKWATDAGLVKEDPTDRVKVVKPKIKGFAPWNDEDVTVYRDRWPIGTRRRVWLEALIGTGLRRGDVVRLGRQHVRDGVATIKTEKTDTEVTIPISPELADILSIGPTGDLHFICNALGKPFAKAAFRNAFGEACRAAGITKSAHGVRKYKATAAAYKGATEPELDAMFGWSGGRMAAHYTREASRRRLAMSGASKLRTSTEHPIPSPMGKVRGADLKIKRYQWYFSTMAGVEGLRKASSLIAFLCRRYLNIPIVSKGDSGSCRNRLPIAREGINPRPITQQQAA
jgi:integrase